MSKDFVLGYTFAVLTAVGLYILGVMTGVIHVYGAGASGLGRLICIW